MKLAGNESVVQSRLKMLHIHILLVAPLGTCHMAKPRTDQHQGRVPILPHSASVTAAVALTSFIALVAVRLCQGLCLLFLQLVQRLFHAATDQFLDLPRKNFILFCK